jgi:hypothetical protein
MKKYLLIALAAFGFAACADNIDGPNAPIHNGELEESYIAINLMAADNDTRADDGGYQDGTPEERLVKTAYFFFFDANGEPFNVTAPANSGATAPGGGKNYLSLTLSTSVESQKENISDISNAVLVLNTYKGVYPSQIVAVINWTPDANTAYSLADLHEMLATLGNDEKGYVMSNSVYMDGAKKMIDAVPLTAANIKTSAKDATDHPIDIYVERIAAKVVLTASEGDVVDGAIYFDTQQKSSAIGSTPLTSLNNVDVYVKLHGWELYNDYATSNLLKNISNWDVATLGLTWNDIPFFRCYWAQSQPQDDDYTDRFSWSYADYTAKGFQTEYGFAIASAANYTDRTTYTYCGENTNQVVMTDGKITSDPRTKVILKGQLMQSDGNGGYKPLELAKWYGNEYAGNEALRIAVANSLKYTLYYPDPANNGKYISISDKDIMCVKGADVGAQAYEVGFQLSTDAGYGDDKTWYKYDSTNGYVAFDPANNTTETNNYLKGVEPALLYASGMTYYSVDIEHLGTKNAKYGVVRNHVYQIDIESIKGYGSPVYSGEIGYIKPEYPTVDEASYVAARINVLSWKIVKQGVNITQ